MHSHGELGWTLSDHARVALLTAAGGYALAWWTSRHRTPWPIHRGVCWYAGLLCAAAALIGPVAAASHSRFTAHMAGHLLLGMAAPLLLVLGAPITMALRALPVNAARALARALRSRPARLITHPVVASALNGAGLWVLYTTDLYHRMHDSTLLHAAVHLHILLAGYLFTAALVGVDPHPGRASFRLRATVLVVFIAAHSILAKWLYAHPPAGVGPADARAGAQLMYHGGDAIDVTLIVLLFAGWYTATRPGAAADRAAGIAQPDTAPPEVGTAPAAPRSSGGSPACTAGTPIAGDPPRCP